VQESRVINLVSFTREKKRKRKKRKKLRCHWYKKDSNKAWPISLSRRLSHMQRNTAPREAKCGHASMQRHARWSVPPRRLREAWRAWAAYIMRPMGISAPHLHLPPCLDSNDQQPNSV
jgi:hypothetical protein